LEERLKTLKSEQVCFIEEDLPALSDSSSSDVELSQSSEEEAETPDEIIVDDVELIDVKEIDKTTDDPFVTQDSRALPVIHN